MFGDTRGFRDPLIIMAGSGFKMFKKGVQIRPVAPNDFKKKKKQKSSTAILPGAPPQEKTPGKGREGYPQRVGTLGVSETPSAVVKFM